MAVDLRAKLEQTMKQAQSSVSFEPIQQKLAELRSTAAINKTSVLGNFPDEIQGGFKALNSVVDDVQSNIPSSIVAQQTGNVVIAQLTDQIDQVKDRLIVTPSEGSSIQALTGTAASSAAALLDVVITSPTPQAVADNLKQVAQATLPEMEQITKKIVNLDIPIGLEDFSAEHIGGVTDLNANFLKTSLGDVFGSGISLTSTLSDLTGGIGGQMANLQQTLNSTGFGSVIENAVEAVSGPALSIVNTLTTKGGLPTNIPSIDFKNIISLSQSGDLAGASKLLQKFSDAPLEDIESKLRSIDNSAFTNITKASSSQSNIEAVDMRQSANSWEGPSTKPYAFTIVNSKEELEAEIIGAGREITEVIIDWTLTGINENYTAQDIHEIWTEEGESIPQHFLLTREGNIQRGRPVSIELEDTWPIPNGHNKRSLFVSIVGGINKPVPKNLMDVSDFSRYFSAQSFTQQQWKNFKILVQAVKRAYPGIEILGYGDIDQNSSAPGFNVREYVKSTFGFDSFLVDPSRQPPPTREQIATGQQPEFISDGE